MQPPYGSKFAVCEDDDTGGHVKASDLLVGDAVGLPTLRRLSLQPRHTPTGATLSVPGCALEEFRLDTPSGHPAAFGSETAWQVDMVTAHLCEGRVIGERTIGFSDSLGAKLTVRLGDDQQLRWMNDEAADGSRRDYKFVADLPDPQSDPDTVLRDLRQAGYTATLACPDPRLMIEFQEVARSHDRYLRNRGSRWVCVPFSDTGTLTDITHTRIREIQHIIESGLWVPEHESLRIENRCGDSVRVLADHQMRSATTIMTETRLVGIMVRQPPERSNPSQLARIR